MANNIKKLLTHPLFYLSTLALKCGDPAPKAPVTGKSGGAPNACKPTPLPRKLGVNGSGGSASNLPSGSPEGNHAASKTLPEDPENPEAKAPLVKTEAESPENNGTKPEASDVPAKEGQPVKQKEEQKEEQATKKAAQKQEKAEKQRVEKQKVERELAIIENNAKKSCEAIQEALKKIDKDRNEVTEKEKRIKLLEISIDGLLKNNSTMQAEQKGRKKKELAQEVSVAKKGINQANKEIIEERKKIEKATMDAKALKESIEKMKKTIRQAE